MDHQELPFVSILIPVRDRAKELRGCLQSIQQLDYPKDRYEVIIADGMSTDGSGDVARSFGATVVPNPEKTIAYGQNHSFAASKGDLLAHTDSDCILDPLWLRNAVKYFKDPHVGGVGGPIHVPEQPEVFARTVRYFYLLAVQFLHIAHPEHIEEVRAVQHIPTCNFIARREAMRKVMPLDWHVHSGSDLEISRKLALHGYKMLLTPDVSVQHLKRTTFRGFASQLYNYGGGRVWIGRRDPHWLQWKHIALASSIPFASITGLALLAFAPWILLPLLEGLGVLLALFCGWALVESRSFSVACTMPVTLATGLISWSLGFFRELLSPTP